MLQGGRRDHRRGAADVPQVRHRGSRATRRRCIPWVDVATGSLGQGLPIGVGVALAGKRLDRLPYRVWVLCGDSEMAEGSMWEAFEHAGYDEARQPDRDHRRQPARPARRDDARLGPRLATPSGLEAFGWNAIEIDGHDVEAIDARLRRGRGDRRPADGDRRPHDQGQGRQGGRGQAGLARQAARRPRRGDRGARRRARPIVSTCAKPRARASRTCSRPGALELPHLRARRGGRDAQGLRRRARGARHGARRRRRARRRGLELDLRRDVRARTHPERYFEMFIAEQQLVAAAVGMQVRGWTPFASTFAAFFSRAYDFVRMAAISPRDADRSCGSHAGVSIGEDGPSQMALEDIASLRAVHGSTVLYPSRRQPDRASSSRRWPTCDGISFMRTTRGKTPVHLRRRTRTFPVGGSRSCARRRRRRRRSSRAGITLARGAQGRRARSPRRASHARVIDLYSVKPIDARDAPRRGRGDVRRDRHRRGPLRPRAASARRCSPRWPRPTSAPTSIKLAVREMPDVRQAGGAAARGRHRRRGDRRRRPQARHGRRSRDLKLSQTAARESS